MSGTCRPHAKATSLVSLAHANHMGRPPADHLRSISAPRAPHRALSLGATRLIFTRVSRLGVRSEVTRALVCALECARCGRACKIYVPCRRPGGADGSIVVGAPPPLASRPRLERRRVPPSSDGACPSLGGGCSRLGASRGASHRLPSPGPRSSDALS